MDIETTPKSRIGDENSSESRVSSLGHRHTPTARMSERKRSLFDKKHSSLTLIMDDDVDLGPMSPLQYSSSPNSLDDDPLPFDRSTKQTDFSNLFPGICKSTSEVPKDPLSSPFLPTDKRVLVMEESVGSSIISDQGGIVPSLQIEPTMTELAVIPEENKLMQEKTPNERMINCQDLRLTFKKSLILGDITTPTEEDARALKNHQKRSYSMSVLAEKNSSSNSASTSPKEKVAKLDAVEMPRARTSLTFESISIPTNRFYNHPNDENHDPVRVKRHSAPILLPHRSSSSRNSSSRRSRDNSGVARKGCSHKIKKPVRAPAKEAFKKKVELAVLQDQKEQQEKEKADKEQRDIDEAQTTRIHEIMKNIKNPLEMSRPLFFTDKPTNEDRFYISDEEVEDEVDEKSKRKFFKSGTTGAKSYKLTNNVVATVEGGKISLPKFPGSNEKDKLNKSTSDPSEFSMVEEEFGSEFEEVTDIISKLTNDDEMDAFRSRLPYQTTDPEVVEKQAQLLELLIANKLCTEENFKIFIAEPDQHKEEMKRVMDGINVERPSQAETTTQIPGLFPIFYHRQSKRKLVSLGETDEGKKQGGSNNCPSRKVWKRIGDSQMQIDAGQKRFGATYCAECDLLYSVHEPEDELMHERFHKSLSVLSFPGWKVEDKIREMPQWGVSGRIIAVPWNDHKVKVHRVMAVLDVINKEMGCPNVDLKSKTIVYLAVAQNTILGVCVAEAKYEANRLVTEGGVDYFSEENYPVWCGITRVWVAAPYRNQGVASELVNAVRGHFTVGRTLTIEEIAFQSPTEAGKLLGRKLAMRKDFLVYP